MEVNLSRGGRPDQPFLLGCHHENGAESVQMRVQQQIEVGS
jgi:hypothetical protein